VDVFFYQVISDRAMVSSLGIDKVDDLPGPDHIGIFDLGILLDHLAQI
jgi:hypothetical protein